MRISRSTYETAAFVIDKSSLERLHIALTATFASVTLSVSCADKLERHFESLDEFLKFSNPGNASIEELTMVARDKENRAAISLSTAGSRNVRLSIEAEEGAGAKINASLEEIIDAIRPWYSWIARADWYVVILLGWFLWLSVRIGFLLVKYGASSVDLSKVEFRWRDFLSGAPAGILPLIAGVCLNLVRDKFFPVGEFAIGDGAARYARKEIVRTVVIVAFVVSIASSVVVSWIL